MQNLTNTSFHFCSFIFLRMVAVTYTCCSLLMMCTLFLDNADTTSATATLIYHSVAR